MRTFYFDHCASTPPYEQVVQTVGELMRLHYANATALHRSGQEAAKLVERARQSVAQSLGAKPEEVLFTSGGTESNNLALKGILFAGGRRVPKHLITTSIEHSSVYNTAKQLERFGIETTILPVDRTGRVSPSDVEAAIRPNTSLVSVMHVNNETGIVQPIEEIAELLAAFPQVRFHVDGVQAVGKVPIRWASVKGIDLYSGSAHKFRGPKGVGFLLRREGIELDPLQEGGGQEEGMRGGTHNLPGIVGMSQALRLTMESMETRRGNMFALRRQLIDAIREIPELVLNVPEDEELVSPQVVNLSYPGMRPEVLVHMLEKHGVYVSTQSACSSKSLKPSRVLLAMGMGEERASGSLRISFGDEHDAKDVGELAERLKMTVAKLKPLERSRG
ncbi:cysteine desulfurase family protein [Cohnella thailandensis]|uniref:Cysteine desulfurase n=1 Tax=Cohnella thailandensis TaxID=557557 RepID=A0A841SWF2_9BACL|nr:cysteine desulfurase family protein [Cohnella thailandensis]MBB6636254.1 cysteine desulfurase [Cohnella thailandensis]MBP1973777.1 cysteine desulfurase [Cohnella thailandensis]